MTFTWKGRLLTGAVVGDKVMSFTYNDEGIRTSKTVNGVTTTYYLDGSRIVGEETNGNVTLYIYDSTGAPIGYQAYANGAWSTYWYLKNLQGDIIYVYDSAGSYMASYEYDAYGNYMYGQLGYDSYEANDPNPFRYRGYYYDKDLDLYYVNGRYYDDWSGRWINADKFVSTGQGLLSCNMFAYCNNNPVNYVDPTGCFGIGALAAITTTSMLIGGVAQLISNTVAGKKANEIWRGVASAAVGAGVDALVLCLTMSTGSASLVISASLSSIAQTGVDMLETKIRGETIEPKQALVDLGMNFATTLVENYIGSKVIPTNVGWFQPKKFTSVFTKAYGQKILSQTAIGSALSGTVNFVRSVAIK